MTQIESARSRYKLSKTVARPRGRFLKKIKFWNFKDSCIDQVSAKLWLKKTHDEDLAFVHLVVPLHVFPASAFAGIANLEMVKMKTLI